MIKIPMVFPENGDICCLFLIKVIKTFSVNNLIIIYCYFYFSAYKFISLRFRFLHFLFAPFTFPCDIFTDRKNCREQY